MSAAEPGSHGVGRAGRPETMDVLLFAGLAEALGRPLLCLDAPWPATAGELRERLASEWPELARATFRTAVNQRYVADTEALHLGDEIALIPPVSGG